MPIMIHITPLTPVTEDEVAAALAAVRLHLEQTTETNLVETRDVPRSAWHAAALVEARGMPPVRNGAYATWNSIERTSRARRWSKGIIGL
jgi:hypothetical protein